MKWVSLLLTMLIINTASAQSKKEIEISITPGLNGGTLQLTFQKNEAGKTISGWGISILAEANYKNWNKLTGDNLTDEEYKASPVIYEFKNNDERGPFGIGAGGRIILKSNIAIETGYILGYYREYTIYTSWFRGSEFNRKTNDKTEGSIYAKFMYISERTPFSFGVSYNRFDNLGFHFGYRL